MFGISFSEIILIFVIALFIFGPKELPKIATAIGKFIYTIKTDFYNMKNNLYKNTGLEKLKHTKQEIVDIYKNIRENINMPENQIINSIDEKTAYDETIVFFQPELDFDRQPELFDDLINETRINK